MTPTFTVRVPVDVYLLQLRVLAAWWCLGSSRLEPQVLLPYLAARLPRFSHVV